MVTRIIEPVGMSPFDGSTFSSRQFGKTSPIVYIAVLTAWLAVGLLVVGLLNVVKFLVRSSARVTRTTVSSAAMPVASGDSAGGQPVERSAGYGQPGHTGTDGLPPPVVRPSA